MFTFSPRDNSRRVPTRQRESSRRPRVEVLEDRTMPASFSGLGFLPGDTYTYSAASGVSADGSVVVGRGESQAFRWTQAGGMVGLGVLPVGSFPYCLSDKGGPAA
jgi:probable HAF family extracellular repeat protein